MKKIVIALVVLSMLPVTAFGATCSLPKGCEYLDSEFSTGGGNKVSYVMEVTCKMPDKSIVKYTHWEFSVAGAFGFGRISAPKKIAFFAGDTGELVCNY